MSSVSVLWTAVTEHDAAWEHCAANPMLDPLHTPPPGLFWSAPVDRDTDFTAEDPLALDYLGQQVGNWLFPGFTTRTGRAQYYLVVL